MHNVLVVRSLILVTWQSLFKRETLASTWKLDRNTILDGFVYLRSTKDEDYLWFILYLWAENSFVGDYYLQFNVYILHNVWHPGALRHGVLEVPNLVKIYVGA